MSSSQYIEAEVQKIIKSESEFPLNMAFAATWILAHFKGVNIKIFNASESSSLSDYYLIASMQNTTQANAAVDSILYYLKQNGMKSISVEGREQAEWILVDLGDIIVHLFQEHARDIYDLDMLWADVPQVKIPEEYYFAEKAEVKPTTNNSTLGYF